MPWATIEDVPASVRTHKSAKLTLAQANFWAKTFDGLVKNGVDKSRAAAIAWTFFERNFRKVGDRWVKRKTRVTAKPENPPGVKGRSKVRKRDLRGQRAEDPTMTRNLRDRFSETLRKMVEDVLDRLVEELKKAAPIIATKSPNHQITGATSRTDLEVIFRSIIQTGFGGDDILDIISEEVKVIITRSNRTSSRRVEEANDRAGVDIGTLSVIFDAPVSDAVVAEFALTILGFMENVGVDLANRIMPALEEGIRAGESIPELARRIMERGDIGFSRATTIARTETIRIFNEAAKLRYESHGVNMVEWITAGDERVDPEICEPLEGMRFLIDSAPPNPAHPRCRCSWLPVVIGGPSG